MKEKVEYDPPLDPGIRRAVEILNKGGIETYESCEGGPGHAYLEPTVRFHGNKPEGFKALALVLQHNLPISAIKRLWTVENGEPVGPTWEIVFWRQMLQPTEEDMAWAEKKISDIAAELN